MKSRRLRIVLVAAAGLLAVIAALRTRSAVTGGSDADAARAEVEEAPRSRETIPAAGVGSTPVEPRDLGPRQPAAIESTPSAREVRGVVTLLDHRDEALPPVTGTLRVAALTPDPKWSGVYSEVQLSVDVAGGEWSLGLEELPEVTRLRILELEVEGARTFVESPEHLVEVPSSEGLPVEVRARKPEPLVLRVIDARTGGDLAEVTLVLPDFPVEHPGVGFDERVLRESASSPITLEDDMGGANWLLVGAEGFAWSLVLLDPVPRGEHLVAMRPGADLAVELRNLDPQTPPALALRPSCAEPLTWIAPEHEEILLLRGLPPGGLDVEAWTMEPPMRPMGSVRVELVAGARAHAILELQDVPPPRTATASGRVRVAREWDLREAEIALVPDEGSYGPENRTTATATIDAAGDSIFEWSFELPEGRYELLLADPPVSLEIELSPGAAGDIELRVPPPKDLAIRVADPFDAAPLPPLRIHWKGGNGGSSWETKTAEPDAATGMYRLRAPMGPIRLRIHEEGFLPFARIVDTSSVEGTLTIPLPRRMGCSLGLRDGHARVPIPLAWLGGPEVLYAGELMEAAQAPLRKGLQGPGEDVWWSLSYPDIELLVSAPGVYQLLIPRIPGYEQPPLQRIEVRAGELTRHVVQLEREH